MREAQQRIYDLFGHEYCKRNPELTARLVAAYMQTAAADFDSAVRAGVVDARADK
jgi:hypothetical protein